jgi:carbon-monoxide dehydrogenase large subunit
MKFGIGQPVPRQEDPTLLKGQGRYSDDVQLPNTAHAVMARSQVAHGLLKSIDVGEARKMPGVLGIWTGADLNAAGYGPLKTLIPVPNRDGSPMKTPTRHSLATDKVRFVGDPVAIVVAETLEQARDAVEAVVVGIESLPAVTDARAAAQPGAPRVFDDVPDNLCVDFHYGNSALIAEAFAKANHVTRLRLVSNRIVVCAMEPRSATAHYDAATDRYTFYAGNQGVFGLKH